MGGPRLSGSSLGPTVLGPCRESRFSVDQELTQVKISKSKFVAGVQCLKRLTRSP